MKKKSLIICDDDSLWLERACSIINDYFRKNGESDAVSVFCCKDAAECLKQISADTQIVFMDIELERRESGIAAGTGDSVRRESADGIAAASEINRRFPDVNIVYLTNYLNFALDVYDTDHVWYVLKEEFEQRLPDIFKKLERINRDKNNEIVVTADDNGIVKIPCSTILYIERSGRRTVIKTTEGQYLIREKIREILDILPSDGFARCHNSFIVNLAEVSNIHRSMISMSDGTELLISRGYNKAFREHYMEWAKRRTIFL